MSSRESRNASAALEEGFELIASASINQSVKLREILDENSGFAARIASLTTPYSRP